MTVSDAANNRLDQLVQHAQQLYSLPAVAMQVLELTRHPRVDVAALKDCIENDPALTAKLLRVTNSSLFGLSRQVTDLNQALALLGTKPLKLLVLGFSLPKALLAEVESHVLSSYWQYALTKAVAAREFGSQFWPEQADDAFTAGLLQDLGVLALIQVIGQPFLDLYAQAFTQGWDLCELESSSIGFQHRALSGRMMEDWGLPESIVRVVATTPHAASAIRELPRAEQHVAAALRLADLAAQLLCQRRPAALADLLHEGEQLCGLALEQIEALIASLTEKVQELADVLSLQLPNCDYVELLLDAQSQMSDVAERLWRSSAGTPRREPPAAENAAAIQRAMESALHNGKRCWTKTLHPAPNQVNPPPLRSCDAPPTRARHGPLTATDLVADPGLTGRIEAAINACRRGRSPLSLVLVEIDDFEQHLVHSSLAGARRKTVRVQRLAVDIFGRESTLITLGDSRIAIILINCDRQQAIQDAKVLLAQAATHASGPGEKPGDLGLSVSAGIATLNTPPRNFLVRDLIEAAERCLYAAKLAGGSSVKSIDVL